MLPVDYSDTMDNGRVMALFNTKDSVYFLLALYYNTGASKIDIMYIDGGKGSKAKLLCMQDFVVEYGLATEDSSARQHNTKYIKLMSAGARVVKHFEDIVKEGESLPKSLIKVIG